MIDELKAMPEMAKGEGGYVYPEKYVNKLFIFKDQYIFFKQSTFESFPKTIIDMVVGDSVSKHTSKDKSPKITMEAISKMIEDVYNARIDRLLGVIDEMKEVLESKIEKEDATSILQTLLPEPTTEGQVSEFDRDMIIKSIDMATAQTNEVATHLEEIATELEKFKSRSEITTIPSPSPFQSTDFIDSLQAKLNHVVEEFESLEGEFSKLRTDILTKETVEDMLREKFATMFDNLPAVIRDELSKIHPVQQTPQYSQGRPWNIGDPIMEDSPIQPGPPPSAIPTIPIFDGDQGSNKVKLATLMMLKEVGYTAQEIITLAKAGLI